MLVMEASYESIKQFIDMKDALFRPLLIEILNQLLLQPANPPSILS
jgi:hypothetical protein